MIYSERDHTFIICAYQESKYLEECLVSLIRQKKRSKIAIATSTPNTFISNIAKKYEIEVYINNQSPNISGDWNFAYSCVNTKLVTIVHQDDIYEAEYSEKIIGSLRDKVKPMIIFSDYYELRKGKRIYRNRLLLIKRILLYPLRYSVFQKSKFIRRRILSVGSPICCPSVTFVKDNLPDVLFEKGFKSNIDWQAWEKLSKRKGEFIYCPKPLISHRIHPDSTTSKIIANNIRTIEDYEMLCKFWPTFIAKIIMKLYIKGQISNNVEE